MCPAPASEHHPPPAPPPDPQGINVNCGLLVLSTVAVLLPSLLSETHTEVVRTSAALWPPAVCVGPAWLSPPPQNKQNWKRLQTGLVCCAALQVGDQSELALSRFQSVILLLCYGLFLVFQLVTHRHLYEQGEEEEGRSSDSGRRDEEQRGWRGCPRLWQGLGLGLGRAGSLLSRPPLSTLRHQLAPSPQTLPISSKASCRMCCAATDATRPAPPTPPA
jgi:Ca2+/H+ antiporter